MKKPTSKTRTKRPNGSVAILAGTLGISTRHCNNLLREGMPSDAAGAARWRGERVGNTTAASAELLRLERVRLVRSQREGHDIGNAARLAQLVPKDEVDTDIIRIVWSCKQALLHLQHQLPPLLEGQPAGQISKILRDNFYSVLEQLSELADCYWAGPEVKAALEWMRQMKLQPTPQKHVPRVS